ncbi:hypothetical protein BJ508DRAFT_417090 [Ascobolus immersus RN42]|uniref:Uncharacterized protein n=1 Tax=Ascobolus immersus RN42 TaxID=1160509 RepID=A0A3N4HU68_ASCIM|nr:hypothetical protein BJ508DRAFT_417090 [Ascobolus immersus RN42]
MDTRTRPFPPNDNDQLEIDVPPPPSFVTAECYANGFVEFFRDGKPFDPTRMSLSLRRALEQHRKLDLFWFGKPPVPPGKDRNTSPPLRELVNSLYWQDPIVEPLHQLAEDLLVALLDQVMPRFLELPPGSLQRLKAQSLVHKQYPQIIGTAGIANGIIRDLHVKGMLRAEKVSIFQQVLSSKLYDLRLAASSRETVQDLSRHLERSARFFAPLVRFLRFRSERLELLLLRYLNEDGVNFAVVRGVEEATGRHQEFLEGLERDASLDLYEREIIRISSLRSPVNAKYYIERIRDLTKKQEALRMRWRGV